MDEGLVEHISVNEIPDAKQWLFMLNESMSHEDFTTVVVSLWAIWTARRKALHEELFQSPMTTFGFIQSYLKDLQLIPAKVESKVEASRSTSSTKMIRPPPSFMKINVDAAILRTGTRGSVSALCRSEQGVFVGASTRVIDGVFDPTIMEAMACAEGLSLAHDLQLQRICLASDCLEVVQSVMASSMGKYGIIIKEIKARKAAFDEKARKAGRVKAIGATVQDLKTRYTHTGEKGKVEDTVEVQRKRGNEFRNIIIDKLISWIGTTSSVSGTTDSVVVEQPVRLQAVRGMSDIASLFSAGLTPRKHMSITEIARS
nr:uncharacterized protein LOC127310254 [Lolium perenne]